MAKNCLLIYMPRSGSTVLIRHIRHLYKLSHSRLAEFLNFNSGEEHFGLDQHGREKIGTFDVRAVAGRINKESIVYGRLQFNTADYRYELQRRYEALRSFGWPTMKVAMQDWRLLAPHQKQELADGYDSVITLDRRDFTEATLSNYYALYRQQWHREGTDPKFEFDGHERIHPSMLKKIIREYQEFKQYVEQLKAQNKHTAQFSYEQIRDVVQMQHLLSTFCGLPFDKNPKWQLWKGVDRHERAKYIRNYDHLKSLENMLIGEHDVTFLPRTGIEV